MTVFISGKITGNVDYRKQSVGLDNCDYADVCKAMIDSADMVVFLPNWQDSKGAQLERAYCCYVDKPNIDLEVSTYEKLLQGL